MTTQPLTHEQYLRIRAEHAEIGELVATLYRVLAERHQPAKRIGELLNALRERCVAHFADEESSGLFHDLVDRHPSNVEAVKGLRKEHRQMGEELLQLGLLAHDPLSAKQWECLDRGFREFGTRLCHHETRENDLIQAAFGDDLGSQD